MIRTLQKRGREESGAVQILEATFVFPLMFIILFFLIFMGNAHYIKAQVEAAVTQGAIRGANACADANLQNIKKGTIPTLDTFAPKPYRYLFGGNGSVEEEARKKTLATLRDASITAFAGMEPKMDTSGGVTAKFHNYILYSTFEVEAKYSVNFPIRMLGESAPPMLSFQSRAEVPISDAPEFIRNTDMVLDYVHGTKIGKKMSELFGKVNKFLSSIAGKEQ